MTTNFAQLRPYDEQLFRLGLLAERYFPEDPNTALIKLRQLGERLAQQVASRFGVFSSIEETQLALIRRLETEGLIEREVAGLFHDLRITGNTATHGLQGDHASALSSLKIGWQLGIWFHRTFGDPEFRSGPFRPPQPPVAESDELKQELARLQDALEAFRANEGAIAEQLSATETQLRQALDEQQQWEHLAEQVEADKAALSAQLQALQNAGARQPAAVASGLRNASRKAAGSIELDEAATRQLIDEQLRQAGWEADSQMLRFSKGARPQKNRHRAIAEWPTTRGWGRPCKQSWPPAAGPRHSASGCSASPTKPRRSQSWTVRRSMTTPCSFAARAAAGQGSTSCSAASWSRCSIVLMKPCGR